VDIPLPIGEHDVDEIEVPGLAHYSDDEGDDEMDEEELQIVKRPKSLLVTSSMLANEPLPRTKSQLDMPTIATRKRSMSLPTPGVPHFSVKNDKHVQLSAAPEPEAEQEAPAKSGTVTAARDDVKVPREADAKSHSSDSEYDDAEEEVTFEEAEIMTSSRVSMSGSAHSTDSDTNGKASNPLKRSSSVHSARIVDVSAPRSPVHSRPTSVDVTERPRPGSLSGAANNLARMATVDDRVKANRNESSDRKPATASSSRSSNERRKASVNSTAPISELEEGEATDKLASSVKQHNGVPVATAVSTAGSPRPPTSFRQKGVPVTLNTKIQTVRHEQSPASARAVPVPSTPPATVGIDEEDVPHLHRKAPGHSGWQSPKVESKGLLSIERTRTRESDELSLPVQQNTPAPRQVHTAASSVSSAASRLKPVRTSEDNSSRSESVARNFEELIQSNQTITYTLTPENMRDFDVCIEIHPSRSGSH
jgi:hypothetical protein